MQPNSNPIAEAQAGNPPAAGELYHRYHQSIFRYLYFRTGDSHAAEDLTGDVFLKMVQALPAFKGDPAVFRSWLFQIARNLSIDHFRKIMAHPMSTLSEEFQAREPEPEKIIETRLDHDSLRIALRSLGDDQKDVILMRFIEGMPLAETARAMHKSEDAIKGLQRRALAALRAALNHTE